MKTYNEMAEEVFRLGDERIKTAKSRKKSTAAIISAVFVAVIAVTVWQSGLLNRNSLSFSGESGKGIFTQVTNADESYAKSVQTTSAALENTTGSASAAPKKEGNAITSTPKADNGDGGELSGGVYGGICIPLFPRNEKIEFSGEKITDADAKKYFEQNKASLISSLSASGIYTGSAVIKENGYCHITYSGIENECLTVKQDFRDYLVYNGDKIIAIVTLYKQDGKIYSSPAFGAPWFEDYANYLNQHRGEELLFVYAGQAEIIVAPDGTYRSPLGYNCSQYFEGVENLYSRLYCPEIVYIP